MLKPIPEMKIIDAEYIFEDRLPAAPAGYYWAERGSRHWRYLHLNKGGPVIWVVCRGGRLFAGMMNSGVGHWLSFTEEKEQILQLLTKRRIGL